MLAVGVIAVAINCLGLIALPIIAAGIILVWIILCGYHCSGGTWGYLKLPEAPKLLGAT